MLEKTLARTRIVVGNASAVCINARLYTLSKIPTRRKTTAKGMDKITIGNARTARIDRRNMSLPRKINRDRAYPAGAAITVERSKVITATTILFRRPGRTPLEFRKNSNVSVDKGIKGKTPLG